MAIELHLPDLAPVAIVGGAPPAPIVPGRVPWSLRLRDALTAYLPLLLMTLLALFTWWLVKNTPGAPAAGGERPLRSDADYTMSQFALERFDAGGRLKVRVEGLQLRHLPDTDRIEVDDVRIRALSADGRVTLASARRAISNGDASEVQLLGDARVDSVDASQQAVQMRGEFLHLFLDAERVRSHLPVAVTRGGMTVHAAGLEYDHGLRRLELKGPMRALIPTATRR